MNCPACGGPTEPWLVVPGSEPADESTYELARCSACGTAVTLGVPPGPAVYASGIYGSQEPRLSRVVDMLQRASLRLPRRLLANASVKPGARVLDAGAGTGRLVNALRSAGYDAAGIDASPRAELVERAEIEQYVAHDLDGVILWHVLEHLPNPGTSVARVAAWLRPGGVVVTAVPNIGSLQAQIAGAEWFHLDVPRHRTHLTVEGLLELAQRNGLTVERVRHLVPEHNFAGMWFALLGRLGMSAAFPFHLVKRNTRVTPRDVVLLAVAGPLLLAPAVLLELAAAAAGRGGTIAVVARAQRRS